MFYIEPQSMRISLLLAVSLLSVPAIAAELPGFPHGFPISQSNYTSDERRSAEAMCQKFYADNRKFSTADRKGLGIACGTLGHP